MSNQTVQSVRTYSWDELRQMHDKSLPLDLSQNENIVTIDSKYYHYNIHRAKVHYIASSPTLYIHFFNEQDVNVGSIGVMGFERLYVNHDRCYFELKR